MKGQALKIEADLDNLRNKKMKGTSKKQKEKQGMVNYKLTQVKKQKEKIEEVSSSLELIDGSLIKNLKHLLTQYMGNPDEEGTKTLADAEITKVLEIIEANKKA